MVSLISQRYNHLYAVMGSPISHSLSPEIHQLFAEKTGILLSYEKIDVPSSRFEGVVLDFFNQGGMGLNITLPFKERAYNLAQMKSVRCQESGAANTLWMNNGVLHADNTDGVGLLRDISRHVNLTDKVIVLIGAGGAARGVIGSILQAQPEQLILSNRTMEKARVLQQWFPRLVTRSIEELTESYDIIINATSSSLNHNDLMLPKTILANHPFCYDLAYSIDSATPFVRWAQSQGSYAMDGIGMLIEQAAESFFIWHGVRPDTSFIRQVVNQKKR